MHDDKTADASLVSGNRTTLADYRAQHFLWQVEGKVATIVLNRPERKNPLTFASYAELRDLFRALTYATDVKAVDGVCAGAGAVVAMASDLRLGTQRT